MHMNKEGKPVYDGKKDELEEGLEELLDETVKREEKEDWKDLKESEDGDLFHGDYIEH